MGKRIAITLLLLPAAEIGVFLLVAWAIGFLPAIGLMILTSLAGGLVLSRIGRRQIARFRGTARQGGIAQMAEGGGLMSALGGILLLLPGFITDLVGAGLLIGPIRRGLGAAIGRAIGSPPRATGPGSVVDLAPSEWQSVPDDELPRPDGR